MGYRELAPPPHLAKHVACFWVHEAEATAIHAVVPDACADVISIDGGAPMLVGPATTTDHVELHAGATLVGVRFLPGSLATVLAQPADELVDREVALADVWPDTHELAARLGDRSVAVRLAALEAAVARIANLPHRDPISVAVVRWLAAHPGAAVEHAIDALGLDLGHRQLARRVRRATGYAPKLLQRILRFQRALVGISEGAALAVIAHRAGFADQAHLTREVRALAATTPSALRGRELAVHAMSAFFKTAERAAPTLRA